MDDELRQALQQYRQNQVFQRALIEGAISGRLADQVADINILPLPSMGTRGII
jgi:hypothetical protein